MNRNTIELAEMLDISYYTLGTTGRQAIIAMLTDVTAQFDAYPANSDVFDWLDNEDGSRSTFSDVIEAIMLCARRYEEEELLDIDPLEQARNDPRLVSQTTPGS